MRFTSKKGLKKFMHIAAAALLASGLTIGTKAMASIGKVKDNSIYGESVRVTPEYLEEISKIENKNNSAKPNQDKNNTSTNLGQNNTSNEKPSTKPVQNNNNNSKPNQSNSNKQEINNNNKKPSQSNSNKQETNNNSKPEENNKNNEIKKIYGGEISASENGIRTEEDILYAVNQMVEKYYWQPKTPEQVKKMMDGLLDLQRDFDIDPLCAIAVFYHESWCGLAYVEGGPNYERPDDYRLANIKYWEGQMHVDGFSNGGYAYHDNYVNAAYDFGNYVRNAKHYAKSEKGAQTMADLEHFDGLDIFTGAGTADANTYDLLKSCLEKRITKNDVKKIAESCLPSDIKDLTNSLINKQKSASKAMAGR